MWEIDPYSAELRYTIDLMVFYALNSVPSTLRVATNSSEIAKMVIRRLPTQDITIYVNNEKIQHVVQNDLGINTYLFLSEALPADVVLFPFSLEEKDQLCGENIAITSAFNPFSYKSLIYPGKVQASLRRTMSLLKSRYLIRSAAALYSPTFILYYTFAKVIGHWSSPFFFHFESLAMAHLIDFSWQWRFSYIVVITGRSSI